MPDLDERLQKRYALLVEQHQRGAEPLATAAKALPNKTAKAQAQAAWRFFKNRRTTLAKLIAPLQALARNDLRQGNREFVLEIHDWCFPHYYSHPSKTDQTVLSHSKDIGYELATGLLVDTLTGCPIAPIEQRLLAKDAVHSSRQPAPGVDAFRLDEVLPSMQYARSLDLPATLVHVIDQEADSVAHLRDWDGDNHLFVVRAEGTRTVRHAGVRKSLAEVAATLKQRGGLEWCRELLYEGNKAVQYVGEAEVVLDRPAQRHRRRGLPAGKEDRKRIPGKALRLRLVVTEVRSLAGEVLAEWLLLSNLPARVADTEVALWYQWRSRVESYHKLIQSAGMQLESWQQETAGRIAKRLAVANMACALGWLAARTPGEQGERLRAVAIRLSGRQVKAKAGWTMPALLVGLGVLTLFWRVLADAPLLADILSLQLQFSPFLPAFSPPFGFV
jgi:hypothetical protein